MTPAMFTTRSLPPAEQFEAWRGWYASVFDMMARQTTAEGFRGKAVTWILDGFAFSCVSTPPVSIDRSKTMIRRDPVDHWCVSLSKTSSSEIKIGNGWSTVPAMVPYVYSLGEEASSERSLDRIQLYLARDSFQTNAPLLDAARGKAFDTPEGRLLADYMLLLERNIPNLPAGDGPKLALAIQAMLGACLAPSADRMAEAGRQIDLTLMARVRQAVRKNLRSPSLGPDKLCREAATSRSQLYRLLEGEGGVVHYIQRRRLSESFTLLCDPSSRFSIGQVAEMLCFADGSSFSRAFRREFGMSPSDVRAGAVGGSPPMPPLKNVVASGIHNFSECLRSL
jgi:AraC-like DNA-binding protein